MEYKEWEQNYGLEGLWRRGLKSVDRSREPVWGLKDYETKGSPEPCGKGKYRVRTSVSLGPMFRDTYTLSPNGRTSFIVHLTLSGGSSPSCSVLSLHLRLKVCRRQGLTSLSLRPIPYLFHCKLCITQSF